jgi:hypothetical protein
MRFADVWFLLKEVCLLIKSTLSLGSYDPVALVGLSVLWFCAGYAALLFAFGRAKKTGRLVRVA